MASLINKKVMEKHLTLEQRVMIFLMKEELARKDVYTKSIMEEFDIDKGQAKRLLDKMADKRLINKINFCTICKFEFKKIPMDRKCRNCGNYIIRQNIQFNNYLELPRFLIKINEVKGMEHLTEFTQDVLQEFMAIWNRYMKERRNEKRI